LCLNGFPPTADPVRRTLVYLGPGELRAPGDDRPTIVTDDQVAQQARDAGVRIDALATAGRDTAALAALTRGSGGTLTRVGADDVDGALDAIGGDDSAAGTGPRRDAPGGLLVAAVAVAALTAAALIGVRR
jgi:predicted component of type VI protein secretion system